MSLQIKEAFLFWLKQKGYVVVDTRNDFESERLMLGHKQVAIYEDKLGDGNTSYRVRDRDQKVFDLFLRSTEANETNILGIPNESSI